MIRDHNRLNGLRFVAIEFGSVGVVAGVLAAIYSSRSDALPCVITFGIGLNTVPVVWLAIRSIRAGEPSIGLRAMRRPEIRAQAVREVPTMQRDTLVLSMATLIPFPVVLAVLADRARAPGR